MVPEQEQTAFDWIRQGRDELPRSRNQGWKGNFVSHLIPPIFERYTKLLHTIEAHHEFIDKPLSASENAILGIPTCEPLRSFVERRRIDIQGAQIRWKELAELLDVPFAPTINHEWYRKKLPDSWCWPRLLNGPDEGRLSQEECEQLASALKRFTGNQDCFFRFSDIPFYARSGEPQLYSGTLDQVAEFQKEKLLSFEYWWPSDKSWCVCSDYDLCFTVIAGESQLASVLLKSGVLECIEVDPRTRIDAFAPMP